MFDRNVSKILARCLEDVENGRTSIEECLRQHPAHANELRRYFELHQHMARLQRPEPSATGERRGRQQLLTTLASHDIQGVPQRMTPNLLSSAIAKAIAGAVAGAILLTGAAGASAAMGGPDVPEQALSALGLAGDHSGSASPTATATTTATSHLDVTTTPGPQEFVGLCNAWSQGSTEGQANKRDATAFKDLTKAAGAQNKTGTDLENAVSQFCEGIAKPNGTAGPTITNTGSTATSTTTPGHGNDGNGSGNGNPTGRPDGRPTGTPTPPANH